tara:strand:- start:3857 stop:4315 length:459 start_codon:yes stop_codon:yes gene_type:complete
MKKILISITLAFIIAQFFSPEKNNADISTFDNFITETKPSEEVLAILENSCLDCHSNHTQYPWYNSITPINYWMAKHVKEGKKHFNISKWDTYSIEMRDHKIDEVAEMVEENTMPLPSFTWTHKDAILTTEQKELLDLWTKEVRAKYQALNN